MQLVYYLQAGKRANKAACFYYDFSIANAMGKDEIEVEAGGRVVAGRVAGREEAISKEMEFLFNVALWMCFLLSYANCQYLY